MLENGVPVFVVTFATQEVLYFKTAKTGGVIIGAEDRVELSCGIIQNIFQPLRWAWIPTMLSRVAKRRDWTRGCVGEEVVDYAPVFSTRFWMTEDPAVSVKYFRPCFLSISLGGSFIHSHRLYRAACFSR